MGIIEALFFTLLAIVGVMAFGATFGATLLPCFIVAYRPKPKE